MAFLESHARLISFCVFFSPYSQTGAVWSCTSTWIPIYTCNDFSNEISRTGFLWLAKKHSYFFLERRYWSLVYVSVSSLKMENICTRLLKKSWSNYNVGQIPHIEGIYVIGTTHPRASTEVVYVGRSNDIHRRMVEHKRQDLAIDKFVKKNFAENGGIQLRVKWIEEHDQRRNESDYIRCVANKLGYWPRFNINGWIRFRYYWT